jgi:hypothetical protein
MPADTVNSQVTDAVTQANVKVLAEAPAMSMGSVYQTLAHATGLMMQNAVSAQQQTNITAQAATTQGVMQIYSVATVADADAVAQMAKATGDAAAAKPAAGKSSTSKQRSR